MTKKFDEIEVNKLHLEPGDVLAVKLHVIVNSEGQKKIVEHLEKIVPDGVKIIIYNDNMDLIKFKKGLYD